MRLSIIIANYNHRDFVGAAIESALAVDWPDKEVIVVDDASTDDSRGVIEGFDGRVAAHFRPRSYQLGAHMFGFDQSTGDIIIFLDSDDLLEPEVMREVAKIWRPGVSKVQYPMSVIDATGAELGSTIPRFLPNDEPEKLRHAYLRTMAYTTPPGSGNAYSRDLVRKVFEFGPTAPQSDGVLLTAAPLLGEVLTIRKPLARYRIHATNTMAMASLDAGKLRIRLEEDVVKARLFAALSQEAGLSAARDPLRYSISHLEYRLASYLVEPSAHPFPADTKSSLVYYLMSSAVKSSQIPLRYRMFVLAWTIACALIPPSLCQSFVLWRFIPMSRPRVIKTLLAAYRSLRSRRIPRPT
jgi:glycosyltransferase involved in cell wall biosynthesis